jgi:hypothetical protein
MLTKMRKKTRYLLDLFSFGTKKGRMKKKSVGKISSKSPTKKITKDVQKTKDITKDLSEIYFLKTQHCVNNY